MRNKVTEKDENEGRSREFQRGWYGMNQRIMPRFSIYPYYPCRVCTHTPVVNASFFPLPPPLDWSRLASGGNGTKWLLTGPLRDPNNSNK